MPKHRRGTARLLVVRETRANGRTPSEWLRGSVPWSEVGEEAQAILTDPRDCVKRVEVWSERWQQFDSVVYRRDS